jgi:hypothetical protein
LLEALHEMLRGGRGGGEAAESFSIYIYTYIYIYYIYMYIYIHTHTHTHTHMKTPREVWIVERPETRARIQRVLWSLLDTLVA